MRPLQLTLKPSRQLRLIRWLLLIWLVILFWQQLPHIWATLLTLIAPFILPTPQNPRGIYIDTRGQWFLNQENQLLARIELHDGVIFSHIIFCRYQNKNHNQTLLLFADQTDNQSWRKLQNRIRWRNRRKNQSSGSPKQNNPN